MVCVAWDPDPQSTRRDRGAQTASMAGEDGTKDDTVPGLVARG